MKEFIATHRKAIVGGALAAVAGAVSAIAAGGDWKAAMIAGVVAALGGGAGVSVVPNKPAVKA